MFIGRKEEIAKIKNLFNRTNTSVLIYGKRKVGKTTLLKEAMKYSSDPFIYYQCLNSTLQDNINEFSKILFTSKLIPFQIPFTSFQQIFEYLNTLNRTINIVIDEYPYLKQFEKSETVDSIFQKIIDNNLSNIRLFISGSHLGMMKNLLLEKNALYGRFSLIIKLDDLNYKDSSNFYSDKSVYDKVAFYSIFGGSPYINEQLDETKSLKENIINTILNTSSNMYNHVENLLFTDLFNTSTNFERILSCLKNSNKKYSEIENILNLKNNGLLSKNLNTLLDMEIIAKNIPINRKDDNKKVTYYIKNNLLRFYYTYIYTNKSILEIIGSTHFYEKYVEPSLITFISHRFEDIVKEYFSLKVKSGELNDIYNIGTYYYNDSKLKINGEFDVVLQKKDIYDFYEVKYHNKPLSLKDMQLEEEQIRKIKGLNIGKIGFVSVNGFEQKDNKYNCIDGEKLY